MASIQNLYETVGRVLGNQASKVISALGEITVECLPEHYVSVMTTLRDHEELHFELLVDLCGVDYSTYKNEAWQGKRFAVVSQLLSVKTISASVCVSGFQTTISPWSNPWFPFITARIGTSAKPSICTASCSTTIPICAAS